MKEKREERKDLGRLRQTQGSLREHAGKPRVSKAAIKMVMMWPGFPHDTPRVEYSNRQGRVRAGLKLQP